jgi:hypothetical protein
VLEAVTAFPPRPSSLGSRRLPRARLPDVADLLAAATGHTDLLISHDLADLDRFDQVVVLDGGGQIS